MEKKMSFKYLGYDVASMMYFISDFSHSLKIEKCGRNWEVVNIHNNGDKFTFEGESLPSIIVKAFKPFKGEADKKRARFKAGIDDACK